MEIKIMINDSAGTAGKQVAITGADAHSDAHGAGTETQANGTASLSTPAISAGAAPAGLAFGGNNAPMTFIPEGEVQGIQSHPSDQSAGAAPSF